MDKKELKFYVTPEQEVIETELEGFLCGSTNAEGVNTDPIDGLGDIPEEPED
jgi:hypothetical protein